MIEDRKERRGVDLGQCEGAYVLAILYTIGYLGMMAALMVIDIPVDNRELMLTLAGIMSAAQLGIIKFYYDGSQASVKAQAANIVRASRNEGALQEIAKAAPAMAAAVPGTPIPPKVDTMTVESQTTNVTTGDQKP